VLETGDDRARLSLVFLPAMLCDDELYRPQIEGLRDLVKPDPLTVAEPSMAEVANAVLRHAPPRFLLAGTSYGGSLALEVVTRAPSRVVGLWLMGCSPGPHRDPAAARLRNDRVQQGGFDAVVEDLAATIVYEGGPHAVDAASSFRRMARRAGPAVFLLQNTSLLARPDRRADLARIICPTLIVWGQEDRLSAVEHGREMGARIPGARLAVLEGCGHLPTLERPDAAVAMVREWLGLIGVKAARRDDPP
jgi:pimeloyl-ACP methyl ester carboxylesterase